MRKTRDKDFILLREQQVKDVANLNTHMHIHMCIHTQTLSCVQLFATPWIIACQAPLPMGFSRQKYWSGLPFPSPGDLPDPGIKPDSPPLQVDSFR